MDPISALGAAGSVVGIASFGLQLSQTIVQYVSQARRARESLQTVLQSIQCTTGVMEQVREFLDQEIENVKQGNKAALFSEKALSDVKTVADNCLVLFWRIEAAITGKNDNSQLERLIIARLAIFNEELERTKKSTLPKLDSGHVLSKLECLKWPYVAPRLEAYSVQLHRLQINLTLIFQIISIQALKRKPTQRTEDIIMMSEIFMRVRRTAEKADLSSLGPHFQNSRAYARNRYGDFDNIEGPHYRPRLESPSRPSYLNPRDILQPRSRYLSLSPPPRRDTTNSEPTMPRKSTRKPDWDEPSQDIVYHYRNHNSSRQVQQNKSFENKHSTAQSHMAQDNNRAQTTDADINFFRPTTTPQSLNKRGEVPTGASRKVVSDNSSIRSHRGSMTRTTSVENIGVNEPSQIPVESNEATTSSPVALSPDGAFWPEDGTSTLGTTDPVIVDKREDFNSPFATAEMSTAIVRQETKFVVRRTYSDSQYGNSRPDDQIEFLRDNSDDGGVGAVTRESVEDTSRALQLYRRPPWEQNPTIPTISMTPAPPDIIDNRNAEDNRRNADSEAGNPAHVNLRLNNGTAERRVRRSESRGSEHPVIISTTSSTSTGIPRVPIRHRLLAPFTKLFRKRDTKSLISSNESFYTSPTESISVSVSDDASIKAQSFSKTDLILKIVERLLHRDFVGDDDDVFPIEGSFVSVFIIKGTTHHEIPHAGKFQLRHTHARKLRAQRLGEEWWKLFAYLTAEEMAAMTEILKPHGIPMIKFEKSVVHLEEVKQPSLKLLTRNQRALLAVINNEPMAENIETQGMPPQAGQGALLPALSQTSAPLVTKQDYRQELSSYETYAIRKFAKPKRSVNDFNAQVTVTKEHFSGEDAMKRISLLQMTGPSAIDKKLGLDPDHQRQIASILAEKVASEQDPTNFEWKLAQLDTISSEKKGEATLLLFLCRAPKTNVNTLRLYQRLHSEDPDNPIVISKSNIAKLDIQGSKAKAKPKPKSKSNLKKSRRGRGNKYLSSDDSDSSETFHSDGDSSDSSIQRRRRRTRRKSSPQPRTRSYERTSIPFPPQSRRPDVDNRARARFEDLNRSYERVDRRREVERGYVTVEPRYQPNREVSMAERRQSYQGMREPYERTMQDSLSMTRIGTTRGDYDIDSYNRRRSTGRPSYDPQAGALVSPMPFESNDNVDIVKQLLLEWTPLEPAEDTPDTNRETSGIAGMSIGESAHRDRAYHSPTRGRNRTRASSRSRSRSRRRGPPPSINQRATERDSVPQPDEQVDLESAAKDTANDRT